jgi:hypothetical protein
MQTAVEPVLNLREAQFHLLPVYSHFFLSSPFLIDAWQNSSRVRAPPLPLPLNAKYHIRFMVLLSNKYLFYADT